MQISVHHVWRPISETRGIWHFIQDRLSNSLLGRLYISLCSMFWEFTIVVANVFYGHMTFQTNIHIACKVILSTSGELYIFFFQPCNAGWILCCRTFTARCHWSRVIVFSTLKYFNLNLFCQCFRIVTVVSKQRICLIAKKRKLVVSGGRQFITGDRFSIETKYFKSHLFVRLLLFCFVLLVFVIIFKPKKALYTSMESRLLFINFHFTVL